MTALIEKINITDKLSVFISLKVIAKTVYLVLQGKESKLFNGYEKLIDYINGLQNARECSYFFHSYYKKVKKLNKHYDFKSYFVWNGNNTASLAIKEALGIELGTFFELANLPNRLYAGKNGVNAQSILYSKPEILDSFNLSNLDYKSYEEWLRILVKMNGDSGKRERIFWK
ncbi:hypothetical protein NX722_07085 [Endozoicomonas gorgoniicola]|uniref:Uncharacterized protein n=1 Tax=Endozoicomonas gorgoniicola TaxID=1234144 RepID=A0ABT3MSP5_9GAMM|nr:hypothetical protein [Endozoicomonas gorgoniicola]MCW7552414.1 hypothetical protein [Endozoicomonas gorgoniicola]